MGARMFDPEGGEEWQEEVWASSLEKAQARCEAIVRKYKWIELLDVSQKTKRPSKGEYLFICWFRAEGSEHDSNN